LHAYVGKACVKCGKRKRYRRSKSCIFCQKVRASRYWRANKKRMQSYIAAWRAVPENAYRRFLGGLKRKTRVLENELSFEQFAALQGGPCVYCGERSWGVDRVKNEFGYTLLNSVGCCKMCNQMKHCFGVKAFLLAVNAAAKYSPNYPAFRRRWLRTRKKLEAMKCPSLNIPALTATEPKKSSKPSARPRSRAIAPSAATR